MKKCGHTFKKQISERLKAKDFLFEVKTVPYSSELFLGVGYMIANWTYLLVYLKYKSAST